MVGALALAMSSLSSVQAQVDAAHDGAERSVDAGAGSLQADASTTGAAAADAGLPEIVPSWRPTRATAIAPTPTSMPVPVVPAAAPDAATAVASPPAIDPATLPKLVVSLSDAPVFSLRLGRGDDTVEERVARARRALEAAAKNATVDRVTRRTSEGAVVVFVGDTPIVQLTVEDALAAGDASLEVHASAVLSSVRDAIAREQQRREIANTLFSVSLVVLFGLIMVYLLRRFHDLADRGATYLSSPGRSVSSVRMSSIEVIESGTLRSMLLVALSVARWLGSIGVVYAWLIVVLSLFESTREYTHKLTGYVVNPLGALMGRAAASVPTFVVAVVAALAVALLVRFVGLFFASVARGEASLSWAPPDLATAISVPLRVGIVVSALVFAAPIVTGDVDGSLTRLGELLLCALMLASVPLMANAVVGLLVVWQRRVRVGERAELGNCRGRVLGVDLWSVRMEDATGAEVHVPHLLLLLSPMRVFSLVRRITVEVAVRDDVASERVLPCLQAAAGEGFDQVAVGVTRMENHEISYRLVARASTPNAESTLLMRARDALLREEIALVSARVVDEAR